MFVIGKWITLVTICLTGSVGYAQEHFVKMASNEMGLPVFEPDYLLIQPGDVVVWVNRDIDVLHNVVADPAGIPKGSLPFESPLVDTLGEWSHTFNQVGTYHYHCHPHSDEGMVGKIVVGRESLPHELPDEMNSGKAHHHHSH